MLKQVFLFFYLLFVFTYANAAFVPTAGVKYSIYGNNTLFNVGAVGTQVSLLSPSSSPSQAFDFIPVSGKANTYYLKNGDGNYLNENSGWVAVFEAALNGLHSEWQIVGDVAGNIRLLSNGSNLYLGTIDYPTNPNDLYSSSPITARSGLFTLKPIVTFVPTVGVKYNIYGNNNLFNVGAVGTQVSLLSPSSSPSQAFDFIPVSGKANTYYLKNGDGNYLNENSGWVAVFEAALNGLHSEWQIVGDVAGNIRLLSNGSNLYLGTIDYPTNPNDLYSSSPITARSGLFTLKPIVTFVPTVGVKYNIYGNNNLFNVGAVGTQVSLLSPSSSPSQAFDFIPVSGKANTYYLKNGDGNYLNENSGWVAVFEAALNGLHSEWQIVGDVAGNIRLLSNGSNLYLGTIDYPTNPNDLYSSSPITARSGLFTLKPIVTFVPTVGVKYNIYGNNNLFNVGAVGTQVSLLSPSSSPSQAFDFIPVSGKANTYYLKNGDGNYLNENSGWVAVFEAALNGLHSEWQIVGDVAGNIRLLSNGSNLYLGTIDYPTNPNDLYSSSPITARSGLFTLKPIVTFVPTVGVKYNIYGNNNLFNVGAVGTQVSLLSPSSSPSQAFDFIPVSGKANTYYLKNGDGNYLNENSGWVAVFEAALNGLHSEWQIVGDVAGNIRLLSNGSNLYLGTIDYPTNPNDLYSSSPITARSGLFTLKPIVTFVPTVGVKYNIYGNNNLFNVGAVGTQVSLLSPSSSPSQAFDFIPVSGKANTYYLKNGDGNYLNENSGWVAVFEAALNGLHSEWQIVGDVAGNIRLLSNGSNLYLGTIDYPTNPNDLYSSSPISARSGLFTLKPIVTFVPTVGVKYNIYGNNNLFNVGAVGTQVSLLSPSSSPSQVFDFIPVSGKANTYYLKNGDGNYLNENSGWVAVFEAALNGLHSEWQIVGDVAGNIRLLSNGSNLYLGTIDYPTNPNDLYSSSPITARSGLFTLKISAQSIDYSYIPIKDSISVLHNPVMGFTTYFETYNGDWSYKPEWIFNNSNVIAYSNILNIRTNWSSMEPTEGNYAWLKNQDFKNVVQYAVNKGFRISFRVIAQDGNGTPPYVLDAIRAAGQNPFSTVVQGYSYADVTNPIWQEKFRKFILAFGAAFDDPTVVDYIDANGLGQWGEGNLSGIPLSKQESYWDWHCGVYNEAFKKVILNVTFSQFGVNKLDTDERIPYQKYGMWFRRDGLGSCYISDGEIAFMEKHYPAIGLIGEVCYSFSDVAGWSSDPQIIAKAIPGAPTVQTYINLIIDQAFTLHANTMSFKEDNVWITQNPDLTSRLIAKLGYRLRPTNVIVTSQGATSIINHTWTNDGVGVLPNDNVRWDKKYQISYALISGSTVIQIYRDTNADPGVLVKGTNTSFTTIIPWTVPAGTYKLAVGIKDKTITSSPSLDLALMGTRVGGWYVLGDLVIGDISNRQTVKTSFNNEQIAGVNLFPNPVNNKLMINGMVGKFDLQITDMHGIPCKYVKSLNGDQIVDVSTMPAGFYILSLVNENGEHINKKFLIVK